MDGIITLLDGLSIWTEFMTQVFLILTKMSFLHSPSLPHTYPQESLTPTHPTFPTHSLCFYHTNPAPLTPIPSLTPIPASNPGIPTYTAPPTPFQVSLPLT